MTDTMIDAITRLLHTGPAMPILVTLATILIVFYFIVAFATPNQKGKS